MNGSIIKFSVLATSYSYISSQGQDVIHHFHLTSVANPTTTIFSRLWHYLFIHITCAEALFHITCHQERHHAIIKEATHSLQGLGTITTDISAFVCSLLLQNIESRYGRVLGLAFVRAQPTKYPHSRSEATHMHS